MTVNVPYEPLPYACNGATVQFPITWPFLPDAVIRVKLVAADGTETPLTGNGADYALTRNADGQGGMVTTNVAPASGNTLFIERTTPRMQPDTLRLGGTFDPRTIEQMIDRAVLIDQEQERPVAGSPGAPIVVGSDGKTLAVGNATLTGDMLLRSALAADTGASLVNFKRTGIAGAVARAVDAKLRDTVSVKDFGAKGDNVANDTASIQAAINYAQSIGATLWVPCGKYRVAELFVEGTFSTTGIDIVGEHLGHVGPNATGATIIYTGTGDCLSINKNGAGGYHYRTNIKNVGFWAIGATCNSLIYVKDVQEGTFENISVNGTSDSLTLKHGIYCDSMGIWNVDNCCMTRCENGMTFANGATGNSNGTINATRNNIFITKNAFNLGLMDSFNASENWIEGFETAFLFDNGTPNVRIQAYHTIIEGNLLNQSTTTWTQARALRVKNTTNANPIRLFGRFSNNMCYLNSSGSPTPSYAIELTTLANTALVDVDLEIEGNYFWGVSVAGIHSDDTRPILRTKRNESRNGFYGSMMPNRTATTLPLRQPAILHTLTTAVAAPANTSENTVATVKVPKHLLGRGGALKISAAFLQTGGGTKTMRLRFGGAEIANFDVGTSSSSMIDTILTNQNSLASQYVITRTAGNGTPAVQLYAPAVDTSADVNLTVTVQKGVGADAVALQMLTVEVLPE